MSKKVLAFYVDIRDSTLIDKGERKKEVYNNFYKKFKSLKKTEGDYQISKVYLAGDGVLMISNCKKIETHKLNNLLIDIQKKAGEFRSRSNENIGIGISYGDAYDIQTLSANNETETETVGTPLDLAAKASNFGSKNGFPVWFASNNKNVRALSEQYNGLLITHLQDCKNIHNDKLSSLGNFRFNVK